MGETQLDLLGRLLARLDRYAAEVTRPQLELDLDTWLKVSRALELVAQCCVDLAMELVAKRGLGLTETYREAFVRLAQDGLLAPEQSMVLQGWAGLRNVLARIHDDRSRPPVCGHDRGQGDPARFRPDRGPRAGRLTARYSPPTCGPRVANTKTTAPQAKTSQHTLSFSAYTIGSSVM